MQKVTASALNVRQGPGTRFPVMAKLQKGDIVKSPDASGWVPVELPGGRVGWVSAQHLEVVAAPEPAAPAEEITEWPWLKIARQELGIKEVAGIWNNPRVVEYLKSTTLGSPDNQKDETPWCFTGEVEILTNRGWVRFDELKDEQVAQVWPSGKVDLVTPSRIISKQYHGNLITIKNRSFDLTCDPQHHFWGYWNTSKLVRLEKRPIIDLTSNLHIPTVESSSSENKTISDMDLRLLAAFLADGCLARGRISFQVSQPRKIDRLQNLDPVYTYEAARSYGPLSISPLTTVQFHLPPVFENVFEDYKVLRWDFLWSLSRRQLRLFVEEYAFFDGHQKSDNNSIISTTSKDTADFLCAACALSGLHPRSTNRGKFGLAQNDVLNISFSTKKRTATIKPTDLQRHHGKADLYCVEVPSGLILVRDRNGNPLVTGNCSAFVNWVLKQAGVEPRTNSAWARSWLNWGIATDDPIPGTIVVFSRGKNAGHVGFYLDEDDDRVQVLGGNQGNAVTIAWFPKANLLGYREPKGWKSA